MAQQFVGPVTVTQAQGGRQTVVNAWSTIVGRAPALGPAVTRPGIGAVSGSAGGQVAARPGPAPAVPDVSIDVGDSGLAGSVTVRDQNDEPVISLNGANGLASFGTGRGAAGTIMVRSDRNGPVILATGTDGRITFLDASLNTTLVIDGNLGDIELLGADCAEEFEAAEPSEPGAVMCLDDAGLLRPCVSAYDRRVVGVVSGAGGLRPALRLNSGPAAGHGAALALVGDVVRRP